MVPFDTLDEKVRFQLAKVFRLEQDWGSRPNTLKIDSDLLANSARCLKSVMRILINNHLQTGPPNLHPHFQTNYATAPSQDPTEGLAQV